MIKVHKFNGPEIVVNAELIEFIEETPDTVITLTTGRKVLVEESMEEIVRLVIDYKRSIGRNFR